MKANSHSPSPSPSSSASNSTSSDIMAVDYNATARALASPASFPASGTASRPPLRRLRSSARRSFQYVHLSYKDQLLRGAEVVQRKVFSTYRSMSLLYRILAGAALLLVGILGILVLIYSHRIFDWLKPFAEKWRELPGGFMILWVVIFICAFPPLIGYSTTLSIAGFLYGFPNGWYVAAAGNITGSFVSFIACRTVLSGYVHRLVGDDTRFKALQLVLKHDGILTLAMIRWCPLPYSISNAAMSTFDSVTPLRFTIATAIATPKLFVHIFIGSRLADIVDGQKDTTTTIVNLVSIIGGGILGTAIGFYIYQRTMTRAKQLEEEEYFASGRGPAGAGVTDGLLSPDLDADLAGGMDDDDISLWDNDDPEYRDDSTDEDNIRPRYMDEEGRIGSKSKASRILGI